MFELLSGYGVWHRRYFVLEGCTLHYWNHPNDREAKVETNQPGVRLVASNCERRWLTVTLLSYDLPGSRGQNLSVQLAPQARQAGGEGIVRTAFHLRAGEWPPAPEGPQQPGQCQVSWANFAICYIFFRFFFNKFYYYYYSLLSNIWSISKDILILHNQDFYFFAKCNKSVITPTVWVILEKPLTLLLIVS